MYVFGSGRVRGVEGQWVTGLGLGFTNSGGTWGKWDICVCLLVAVVLGGAVLCLCVL